MIERNIKYIPKRPGEAKNTLADISFSKKEQGIILKSSSEIMLVIGLNVKTKPQILKIKQIYFNIYI